jgi:hypothetical protein
MPEGSRALLLDTNLLLLFLVGGKDPGLVTSSRRLNAFEEDDYYLLIKFIDANRFNKLVSTPHILTEASNLLGLENHITKSAGREAIKEYVQHCTEITHGAQMLVDEPEYHRLGLTDVAIKIASQLPAFVLTADAPLYAHLLREGVEVANFNHVRQWSWT